VVASTTPGYWKLVASAMSGVSAFGATLIAAATAAAARAILGAVSLSGDTMTGGLVTATGTGAPGTAGLKIASAPLLLTPEAGAFERLADSLYLTISTGTARKPVILGDASLTSGRIPFATTNGRLTDTANLTRDPTTGDITLGDGANLVLSGANALGEGCIVLNAAASGAYDSNLIRLGSTAQTGGFVFGSTAAFGSAYGPFFGARGNTYSIIPAQAGAMLIGAGNVATGFIGFYTGATALRMQIASTGAVTVYSSLIIGTSGTAITQTRVYTPTLAPADVSSADEYNEQTFTVTGLSTSDTIVVNPPAMSAAPHSQLIAFRVSAANTLALTFRAVSGTHAPPQGVYRIIAHRS
jgi:hypothetical protein